VDLMLCVHVGLTFRLYLNWLRFELGEYFPALLERGNDVSEMREH